MQWLFTLATSGIGQFLACLILSSLPIAALAILHSAWERYLHFKTVRAIGWPPEVIEISDEELRQETLRKIGWPPPHCDVDGNPITRRESIVRLDVDSEEEEEEE